MGQTHESSLAISSRLLFTAVHYTKTRINALYMYTSAPCSYHHRERFQKQFLRTPFAPHLCIQFRQVV